MGNLLTVNIVTNKEHQEQSWGHGDDGWGNHGWPGVGRFMKNRCYHTINIGFTRSPILPVMTNITNY